MITKGIIKSIDLLGNTCTVHIPFFETAGNDPIIETATVSNTPGSYNGYKVGDAVYVAFEDGNMSTPVIIGKLYLGVEKEKADPRGVSNVEESSAAKKATLPADAKLAAELDSTVPNTTVPYKSLSSIANELNTLNTEVGQMNRDFGNQFKQVSSVITENGDVFRSELAQTATDIRAEVSGVQTALEGTITNTKAALELADDTITAEVTRVETELDGRIKANSTNISANADAIKLEAKAREEAINGITAEYTSAIEQTAKDITARVDTKVDYSNTGREEAVDLGNGLVSKGLGWDLTNDAWTIKAYDQNTDGTLPEEGLELFKVTRGSVIISAPNVALTGYPRTNTIRYAYSDSTTTYPALYKEGSTQSLNDKDINLITTGENGWTTEQLEWRDGKSIWQWTQTAKYIYDDTTGGWNDVITDKVICLTGASSASHWLNRSTSMHTGTQQKESITITAMIQIGSEAAKEDTNATLAYRWADEENFTQLKSYSHSFSTNGIKNQDLIIRVIYNQVIYLTETIKYQPLNSPSLQLSSESGALPYAPTGEKIGTDSVSCTGNVWLNGEILTEGVSYSWSDGTEGPTITVSEITNNPEEFTCTATINESTLFNTPIELKKVFTVAKQLQGEKGEGGISYWLKTSSGVHLGESQTANVTVTAMQKIGLLNTEDVDEAAILEYKFINDSEWQRVPGYTIEVNGVSQTVYPRFDSATIENFAFKAEDLLIRALHGTKEYETETITYSPLNTPILDLDNDSATILYSADGTVLKGTPVSSTATVYLSGDELAATYDWILENCSADASTTVTTMTGPTVTVAALSAAAAKATCTATVTAEGPYKNKTYIKVFSVTKNLQGEDGADAIDYLLKIDQTNIVFDPSSNTTSPTTLTGTCYISIGENTQPLANAVIKYKIDENAEQGPIYADASGYQQNWYNSIA